MSELTITDTCKCGASFYASGSCSGVNDRHGAWLQAHEVCRNKIECDLDSIVRRDKAMLHGGFNHD